MNEIYIVLCWIEEDNDTIIDSVWKHKRLAQKRQDELMRHNRDDLDFHCAVRRFDISY